MALTDEQIMETMGKHPNQQRALDRLADDLGFPVPPTPAGIEDFEAQDIGAPEPFDFFEQ